MSLNAAKQLRRESKFEAALAQAWAAYDEAPDGIAAKELIVKLLQDLPGGLTASRVSGVVTLLNDPRVEPSHLCAAAWHHLVRAGALLDPALPAEELARRIEHSKLALTALRQDAVQGVAVERAMTQVRRFLLLEDRWADFPELSAALIAQAAMNDGAWPFGDDERSKLSGPFAAAYRPSRKAASARSDVADATTRAVAEQYESWPYPAWRRITWTEPKGIAATLREIDEAITVGEPADILVAGCGSGRQAAMNRVAHPNDRIVAIDISAASLAYASERCAALGIDGIDYRQLDIHDVKSLGRRFDVVTCTGVLHHLPDPEAGWAALVDVLKPGGAMHIMVYSKATRLVVRGIRNRLGELLARPMDDDLLREIRRRALDMPPSLRLNTRDFYTLAGVHDLLAHRHEDPFDLPRIRAGIDRLGLEFCSFGLRGTAQKNAYRNAHPDDPRRRRFDYWQQIERENPFLFAGMYDFWCRKPA